MAYTAIRLLSVAAALALAACSGTLPPEAPAPVVPLTHSVEQANAKLDEAHRERAEIEARFAAREKLCAARFFVTSCLDQAREERRARLVTVRAVELEAEYFKRKHAAEERDRALADALREDEARAAERLAQPAPPPREEPEAAAPKKPGITPGERQAAHAAKMKAIAAREKAQAGERAARAAAFEKKQQEVAQRLRRVEEKKAKRAAKEAQ